MKRHGIPVLVAALALTACSSSFYLSESDVAAFRANLRTAASAGDLLDNLQDRPIEVEFDPAAPDLRIRRSNLLEILRGIPELWFLEQVLHQLQLERLSRQIEAEVQSWLREQLAIVQDGPDTPARLERVERGTIRFLAPPVVRYRASDQRAQLDVRMAMTLACVVSVRDPGGIVGVVIGWAIPDGRYPVTVVVNDFALGVEAHLSTPFADTGEVRLRVTPRPGRVDVLGSAPDDVKEGVRRLVVQRLSPTLEVSRLLRYDLFTLVAPKLVPGSEGDELRVTYRVRPQGAEPVLHVVARADDGSLHHTRRRGDAWTAFTRVPMPAPIASDPVLASSGPDRLEVVAVAVNGDIHHATFRDGGWRDVSGPRGIAGLVYAPARPVLVATAPGQLEVVAIDGGGSIRHIRRLDGRWGREGFIDTGPATFPFSDLTGVRAGNHVVVLFVDARDRLWGNIFDLERATWVGVFLLQDRVRHGPAIAACGDGTLDVVYVAEPVAGQPVIHHRVMEVDPAVAGGLALTGVGTPMPGTLDATPTLVCSGYRQVELIGTSQDRLVHNRFLGPFSMGAALGVGWQTWEDVRTPLFGTIFDGRVHAPVAAAATWTGHVHIVVRGSGTASRPLFHNSRDRFRDGRTPPEAVHWRGFERIATRRFVGRPALALRDRQVDVATLGVDGRVWHATVSDADSVRFSAVRESAVSYPVEPAVLPSATGVVDFIVLRPDGRLAHHRRVAGPHDRPIEILPPPAAGSGAAPPAAVTLGNGQLEVVARGADRALYHWRFVRGRWRTPVRIGGDVLSAPILASTGAGRLLLLALGNDRRLYRWEFVGGQWSGFTQVPGDFAISPLFFGPLAAAGRGDGGLDVVVVEDGTGRMFHTWLGSPSLPAAGRSSPFTALGGAAADVPALAAWGVDRLQLIASFRDGRVYASEAALPGRIRPILSPALPGSPLVPAAGGSGLAWREFRWISTGTLLGTLLPLSDDELIAAATDREGRLEVSRFAHWRGLSLAPVFGQPAETRHRPLFRPTLAGRE